MAARAAPAALARRSGPIAAAAVLPETCLLVTALAPTMPLYIPRGLAASCALFLLYVLLLLAAVPSIDHALDTNNETLGRDPMSQIIYDVLKGAYGTGRGSFGLITVLAAGTYGTGLVSAAGTARKLWAMASDGFVPCWLSGINSTTRVPVRAAAAALAAMLLPGLLLFVGGTSVSARAANKTAGQDIEVLCPQQLVEPVKEQRAGQRDWAIGAALSYVPLAINLSYLLPVALRLLPASSAGYDAAAKRVRLGGGFTLGAASRPLFWVSSVWLIFSMTVALSPPRWPIRATTANWAPITTAAVTLFVAFSWLHARRWFRGLASVAGMSYC
ncbi:hypothetical protein TSOC_002202 [Tetrabaena socialis]|uniref:Uncharacterized protein n=1 Tax=Tetrabaena socialis TaxID=47790 RepID=A0A2J8AEP5_9CHLO|nr:hypothetical protein TSOC_002202 [Tetrabaena socialis]|eukprot:PNH10995.1 hypothetical protein TSOC_002202 [Tetrabaena socialis]